MGQSFDNYKRLQKMVDYLCRKIENKAIDIETAENMEIRIRERAHSYFPDKDDLYRMIYASRIKRLVDQYLSNTPKSTFGDDNING